MADAPNSTPTVSEEPNSTPSVSEGPEAPMPGETPIDTAAKEPAPAEARYLDDEPVAFRRHAGRLELHGPGESEDWRPVALAHLFPLSDPDAWLSVQDDQGKEIGILRSLAALGEESRTVLREGLRRRYVVPRILRVVSCRERADLLEWQAVTDRGEVTFVTRGLRDKAQSPTPGRYLISDVEGNRYEVPNLAALDPESRTRLEAHL